MFLKVLKIVDGKKENPKMLVANEFNDVGDLCDSKDYSVKTICQRYFRIGINLNNGESATLLANFPFEIIGVESAVVDGGEANPVFSASPHLSFTIKNGGRTLECTIAGGNLANKYLLFSVLYLV